MTMGEKIQLLRKKQNWSQETLAEKLSVSRQAVSLWERDESQPELDKLLKLAKIFSVTTDYLIDDSVTEADPSVSCVKTSFENNPKKRENRHITELFLLATFLDAVGLLLSALLWKEYQRYVILLPGLVLQLLSLVLAVGDWALVRSSSEQKSDASPMVCKKYVASASYSCPVAEPCYIFSASFSLPWHTSRYAFSDYVPYDLSAHCTVFK